MIGTTVNNYEVMSLLGQGGMGSVYLAKHPILARRVAIKVLRRELAEDTSLVTRFTNEARAASAIRHPNIIEVFDVGTLPDGVPYLMMELLEGETLAHRLLRRGRLTVGEAVDVALQAASALAAAHDKGIVHRDLKPENLFLAQDPTAPSGERLKVLDFGIAKLQRPLTGQSVRTHTGSIMGTPPYMSPEQCRGISSEIDHRTDVYALGIILYEMLTGAPPFLSEGFGDVLLMHLTRTPRPPREIEPAIPIVLEQVVLQALQKEPEHRVQSMNDLVRALVGPGARTTVRQAGEGAVLQVSEPTAELPPRPGTTSTGTRGTTLSSTASQVIPGSERPPGRRRRVAVGAMLGAAVAVVAVAALATRLRQAAPVSLARPAAANLSAGGAQPPPPAPDSPAPGASEVPLPVAPASPPSADPPRALAGTDQTPAADPPPVIPRRADAIKPDKTRARRMAPHTRRSAPPGPDSPRAGASAAGELVPPAPRPEGAAALRPAPAPASSGPPATPPAATVRPRLDTEKW